MNLLVMTPQLRRAGIVGACAAVMATIAMTGSTAAATVSAEAPTGAASLVRDINATKGSDPLLLGRLGDSRLFSADDGVVGEELWKTDGTQDGTSMVKDINPGPTSSRPNGGATLGLVVLFAANDGIHGIEL